MAKVVLVDDEMTIVQMVGELLRSDGHQVVPFTHGAAAVESFGSFAPDLVIANLSLDKTRTATLAILQKARSLQPPALVITITPAGSMEHALEAIRRGAYDYLVKPFALDELKLRIQRALSYRAALAENVALRKQLGAQSHFTGIIGSTPKIREILSLIERVADSDSPILIQGPAGSGKELIARSVHFHSRRRLAPFVSVSCRLLPENLLEAELFGQKKTLFAPHQEDQIGLVREAEGGTLFLDDFGALSISLQSRLLELLQERRVCAAGDHVPVVVDVRVLAAMQDSAEGLLASGTLNRDLHQRLSEVTVVVPPLRDRSEDVPLLIAHFLEGKLHPRTGKPLSINRPALDLCCHYGWPGNVRELESALEHACILCQDSVIQESDLPRSIQQLGAPAMPKVEGPAANRLELPGPRPNRPSFVHSLTDNRRLDPAVGTAELVPLKQFLRDQEISYLHRTLAQVGGSKERAAEVLRISLATMYRKLSEPDSASDPV
ncbi:MAG: sigma-54 dependent transcriptional regulator [Verrucomicrobiota bacterium]